MFYLKWIFYFIFCSFTNFSFTLVNPIPGVVQLIGKTGTGTGFFITPDTLSTVNHVADAGPLYFIDDSTEEAVFTRVLYRDERSDLAVLKIIDTSMGHPYESEDFYPLDSSDETKEHFHQGEIVVIPGFPQGLFNILIGRITKHRNITIMGVENVFMANIIISQTKTDMSSFNGKGLSGAPVFSKDIQLIGVVVLGNNLHSSFKQVGFVPIEALNDLVRREEGKGIFPSEKKKL